VKKHYLDQYHRMMRFYDRMKEICEKHYEIDNIHDQLIGAESTLIGSNKPALVYTSGDMLELIQKYIDTNNVIEELADMIYAFFQNCYHLKDWIKADRPKLKDEVENIFNDRFLFGIRTKAQSGLDNGVIKDDLSITEAQCNLNNGIIMDDLSQDFRDNGFSLSDCASVSIKKPDNEWLITDGNNSFIARKQKVRKQKGELKIYEDCNKYPDILCMKICADLCNGSKHCELKAERIDKNTDVNEWVRKAHLDIINGKIAFYHVYKIRADIYTFDVIELAENCIERWNLFMKDNSLPIN